MTVQTVRSTTSLQQAVSAHRIPVADLLLQPTLTDLEGLSGPSDRSATEADVVVVDKPQNRSKL